MTTHKVNQICPHCSYRCDSAGDLGRDGKAPGPGDVTLCIDCGYFAIVTDDGGLRAPSFQECCDLANNREAMRVRFAWTRMKEHYGESKHGKH